MAFENHVHHLDPVFPSSWQGLFRALTVKGRQLREAEVWYKDQEFSSYGNQLNWTCLLNNLVADGPALDGDALEFKPQFMLLSADIQHHLLGFILHHRHEIPVPGLHSFVTKLQLHLKDEESWPCILLKMLSSYLLTKTVHSVANDGSVSDFQYSFTAVSRNDALSLCQELKAGKSVLPYQHPVATHKLENRPTSVSDTSGTGSGYVENLNTSVDDAERIKEYSTLNFVTKDVCSPDIIVIHDSEEILDDPPNKVAKLAGMEVSLSGQEVTLDYTVSTPESCSVIFSRDMLERIDKLKDIWQGGSSTDAPAEMDILMNSTPDEVKLICQRLELNEMTELDLKNLFQNLSDMSDVISHDNCVEILNSSLYPKVSDLKQSASRNLSGVVSLVADKFPKPFIDSIVVNSVKSVLGTPLADLISKITKDVLKSDSKRYLLRQIRLNSPVLDENIVSIFQTVVDSKTEIEDTDFTELLLFTCRHCQNLEKSTKFGKLMLALINKYGKQITKAHIEIFTQIIHAHSTFLKKSLAASLKKIKPVQ